MSEVEMAKSIIVFIGIVLFFNGAFIAILSVISIFTIQEEIERKLGVKIVSANPCSKKIGLQCEIASYIFMSLFRQRKFNPKFKPEEVYECRIYEINYDIKQESIFNIVIAICITLNCWSVLLGLASIYYLLYKYNL